MRFKIKTEKDKLNLEIATKLSEEWTNQIKKISIEKKLDIQKDFRKILTIIKNEEQQ